MSKQKASAFEQQLENLNVPEANTLPHQRELKLTILKTKKSATISLWLLLLPLIVLLGAIMQSTFHIMLPPWSWLVKYSPLMPVWLRITVFATVLIIIPIAAVLINIFGILWFQYNKTERVLHIAVRMRRVNIIIIAIAGLLALLFIGHTITKWIING